jgi:phospholipase D1/2
MNCQIVRSASNWSIGLNKTESSILQAYYNIIDNSKHYILIENQFFISRSFSEEEYNNSGLTGTYPIINE